MEPCFTGTRTRCNEERTDAYRQSSPGFDFLDPDINVKGLPVKEFAELRKAEPIRWIEQAPGKGGGFNDGGYWAITKHKDVKEVSLRSDVFSSYENCVIPRFPDDMAREDIEVQRFVMLNMDAPHHTRLRKIISRGFTRAPSAGCATSSTGAPKPSPRRPPPRVLATSSSRCRASCRCRQSPTCSGCRRTTATSCSGGRTR
ncbi:steroid C27-monooxygenase domain protein [Mycobacterium xenopi 3993]|nr:steroid C27-monooxygenase domain protein [Mycobacterium xenopi 3993]